MTKSVLIRISAGTLGGLLLVGPALMAQSTPAPAPSTTAPAASAPCTTKQPKPKSRAEAQAVNNLKAMSADPATTPAQMDAALTDFATKYPTSDYLSAAYLFGLQYYQNPAHKDYTKSLVNGEQALKYDPNSVYALITLGNIMPEHMNETDLNYQQEMDQAMQVDQKAIALAQAGIVDCKPIPPEAKNEILATAYSSLARLANIKKDYPEVLANYEKAAQLDDPAHQAADHFYAARAAIELKQYDKALQLLDAAEKSDPTNAQVKAAVDSNRKLIQTLQSAGQK